MANRLLRYESALFRNAFAEGFARKRDRLLLLLVAIFAFFWLRDALSRFAWPAVPPHAFWAAALAALPGFAWHRQLMARLAWLREHSAVAPAAAEGRSRRPYVLAAHALAAIPLLAAAILLDPLAGPAAALLAYAAGAGLAALIPIRIASREAAHALAAPGSHAMLGAILRRQTLDSARPGLAASLLVTAVFALTAAALWLSRGQSDAIRIAGTMLPAFLALLVTCRLDAELIGFLPYAGRRALSLALAVSALPAAGLAAAAAAILVVRPDDMIAMLTILVLLHMLFIVAGLARAWLYPGRNGRSVDLQVQIEYAGLALIAFVLPPLALIALGWRIWWLGRRYSRLLWVQL
jgi:dolichol kinase